MDGHATWRLARRSLSALCAASLVAAAVVGSAPSAALAEPPPEQLFSDAVKLFQSGSYREAIGIFRKVFEKDPNPFVLFNIGRCYEELGDMEAAARYYQRAVSLEGLPREAKVDALMRLERLEDVLVDRKKVRGALSEARLRVDRGTFAARASATERAQKVDGPGPDPAPDGEPVPWLTWTGAGVAGLGLIGLIGGGVVYLDVADGLDKQADLAETYRVTGNEALTERDADKARRAQGLAAEVNALADTIEDDQATSSLLLLTGGVLVVGGATLVILDQFVFRAAGAEEGDAPAAELRLVPTLSGVGLIGTF